MIRCLRELGCFCGLRCSLRYRILRVMNDSTMAAFHGMTKLAASHVARTTPHMYAYAHLVDRGSAMIACRRNCATNRLGRVRNPKSDSLATPTEGPQKQRQGKSESDSPSPSRSRGGGGVPLGLSRSYLVRGTDEVRNPKSEVRLGPLCSQKPVEIRNPKIRSPRPARRVQHVRDPQVRRPRWAPAIKARHPNPKSENP